MPRRSIVGRSRHDQSETKAAPTRRRAGSRETKGPIRALPARAGVPRAGRGRARSGRRRAGEGADHRDRLDVLSARSSAATEAPTSAMMKTETSSAWRCRSGAGSEAHHSVLATEGAHPIESPSTSRALASTEPTSEVCATTVSPAGARTARRRTRAGFRASIEHARDGGTEASRAARWRTTPSRPVPPERPRRSRREQGRGARVVKGAAAIEASATAQAPRSQIGEARLLAIHGTRRCYGTDLTARARSAEFRQRAPDARTPWAIRCSFSIRAKRT